MTREDVIKRIKRILEECKEHNEDDEIAVCYVTPYDADALHMAIKALEKERWIPCSERLPKESSRYFVTRGLKDCNNLWNRVYIVNYSDLMGLCKEKVWWSGNVGKSDFETYDDVLAWMPLPEPYNAETK